MVTAQKERPKTEDVPVEKDDIQNQKTKNNAGFSTKYMDEKANPRSDFYEYADGKWLKEHPKPPKDKPSWDTFSELSDYNLKQLHEIVDECAADKSAQRDPQAQMVGDFYKSAMDTKRIERLKFTPIEDIWQSVSGAKTTADIVNLIPKLHMAGVGAFFGSGASIDDKDSSTYAFYLMQGGLSLPDKEYYLSKNFDKLRSDYREHIAKMFMLKGVSDKQAHQWADTVLRIETDIAQVSRSKTDLRDPYKNYNRLDTSQLDGKYGTLELSRYLNQMGVPSTQYVVVGQPEFFDAMNAELSKLSVDQLKVYLYWKIIHAYASSLHKAVEKENFSMFGVKLNGQQKQRARWKRAIRTIDGEIGEALGKIYVDKHFDANARKEANEMVGDILAALRDKIKTLPWMSPATQQKALDKLDKLTVKIGSPATFRDYSGLSISPKDYVGNLRRSIEFEIRRENSRIGKTVDRSEWDMTPPTVNAYYSPNLNEIVFPAGILQPPFFDAAADPAVNYGAIGAVIGHEITHGFDDQGRQYDANGNLQDWWTPDDAKKFDERAKTVVNAYGSQEAVSNPKTFVNGELTLGENIADMGGVKIAYDALQRRLAKDPSLNKEIDGLTPEQRFFIAYAQVWREVIAKEALIKDLINDPHSPGKYRATIPVINHPGFDKAFPPKPGETVTPDIDKAGVW
jgi:predicted metalloendopeptidase